MTIQSFMVNDMNLKGNELIVFAVIYGYTQDGEHWYYGTRAHLADWCGATKETVSNCLKSLMGKGYIKRREVERYGCVQVQYQAIYDGGVKNYNPTIKNSNTPVEKFNTIDKAKDKQEINKPNNNNRFVPPKPEQVKEYMESRGQYIDADAFCDYWESVGWIRGRTKMKDWKAAARQWAKNDRKWGRSDADVGEYIERLDF